MYQLYTAYHRCLKLQLYTNPIIYTTYGYCNNFYDIYSKGIGSQSHMQVRVLCMASDNE
jgi:hypothetical protein